MKMRRGDIVLGSVFLLMFIVLVIMATGYNRKARTMPLVVGVPGLVLAATNIFRGTVLRRRPTEFKEAVAEEAENSMDSSKESHKKTLVAVGWMVLLVVMIWLIGFTIALPLYTFIFMKSRKESWVSTIVITAIGVGVIYFLFIKALELDLYRGLLFNVFES